MPDQREYRPGNADARREAGEVHVPLHGEFGAILAWVSARRKRVRQTHKSPGPGLL
jgi:hypothetical protein